MSCACPPGHMCVRVDCVNNPAFPSEGSAADRVAAFVESWRTVATRRPSVHTVEHADGRRRDLLIDDVAELASPEMRAFYAAFKAIYPVMRSLDEDAEPDLESLRAALELISERDLEILAGVATTFKDEAWKARRRKVSATNVGKDPHA